MYNITEINKINQFLKLKYEWNKVLDRSRDKNIFLTWEYLSTYWKYFGKGKNLSILYIESNNKIIAIAPLRQSRYGYTGPLGYDVIEPMGYRGLMPEGADYTGLILTEREVECLKLFLNYFVEHDDWDFIYMYDTPETSMIPNLLPNLSRIIPRFDIKLGSITPYVSLPKSMDIFLKGLSRKFRKELRRCMRKLKKDYQKVELKRYDELDSVENAMKIHFKLNQKRWKSKGMLGTFNIKEVRNFYIDVAKLFADNGWLALYFLTVDDEPVAGLYSLLYNQKIYAVVSGFDPEYSQYSIGNLLFMKLIEYSIEKNIKEFDFMKGSELYKFKWTNKYRRNLAIKFVNKKVDSNIYNLGIRIATKIKVNKIIGKIYKRKL